VHCRLLANYDLSDQKQRRALHNLAGKGVLVRTSPFTEKLAVVNSRRAWIGSANATSWFKNPDCIDWGATTRGARLVGTVQAHFNAHWKSADELRA
jgi:hypothetical protein